MQKVRCNCGNEIETDIPDLFDTEEQPGLLEKIEQGDFMTHECPQCGTLLKLEIPVRIVIRERDFTLGYFPDSDREQFLAGKKELPEADRYTFGYPELVEKIIILRSGLDDRIIEIIKYFFLRKNNSEQEITIYFDSLEEKTLLFHIHGLKEDEVGITRVEESFYQKIEKELESVLEKEGISEIVAPPYVSIKKIILEVE